MNSQYIKALKSVHRSAWEGHGEFAISLVELLCPETVVDLGVDYGFSTFCFAKPKKGTVYGVDWFQGDKHCGVRDTYSVVMKLQEDMKKEYGVDNVEIIKSRFRELASSWVKRVDILHVDGFHSYDAVKGDFSSWANHCGDDAVILFHDTVAFPDSVGRFFREIRGDFFSHNFRHSAGLGVITRSEESFRKINPLLG